MNSDSHALEPPLKRLRQAYSDFNRGQNKRERCSPGRCRPLLRNRVDERLPNRRISSNHIVQEAIAMVSSNSLQASCKDDGLENRKLPPEAMSQNRRDCIDDLFVYFGLDKESSLSQEDAAFHSNNADNMLSLNLNGSPESFATIASQSATMQPIPQNPLLFKQEQIVPVNKLLHPLSSISECATHVPTKGSYEDVSTPTVLALTSFPFRIISTNIPFEDLTGFNGQMIGSTFFDLFVSETQLRPCIASCPTLEGLFHDNIVKVRRRMLSRREIDQRLDGTEPPTESSAYCQIHVESVTGSSLGGERPSLFSVKLSPLEVSVNVQNSPGIVYLPMPAQGVSRGASGFK